MWKDFQNMNSMNSDSILSRLLNSDILEDLDQKLSQLEQNQRNELKQFFLNIGTYVFTDIPTRTDKIFHDLNIDASKPVKQQPYRMHPIKQKYLIEEVQYFFDYEFLEPSQDEWGSCILVPKPAGIYRT